MKREVIEAFKKENGNSKFSQKDMTMYLVKRVDSLYDKFIEGEGKIATNRTSALYLKWAVGLIFVCLGYLILI